AAPQAAAPAAPADDAAPAGAPTADPGASASPSASGSRTATGSASGPPAAGSSSASGTQPRIITLANPTSTSAPAVVEDGSAAAAPQDPSGVVVVKTVPSGATVRAGGQTLEKSGRGYVLPVGNHVLEVTSQTGEQTRIPVDVRRDQTVEICYSFDTNSACAAP
ncbi:PEGA domain-containing protein, partial [Myxococcota bacterium]|nr:PEGA domain-containing protein [Myxococcota bacterium]